MKNKYLDFNTCFGLFLLGYNEPSFARYDKIEEEDNEGLEIHTLTIREISYDFITENLAFGKLIDYNSESYTSEGSNSAITLHEGLEWLRKTHGFYSHVKKISSFEFKGYWEKDEMINADLYNSWEEAEIGNLRKIIDYMEFKNLKS
jgi:hypothetical protein